MAVGQRYGRFFRKPTHFSSFYPILQCKRREQGGGTSGSRASSAWTLMALQGLPRLLAAYGDELLRFVVVEASVFLFHIDDSFFNRLLSLLHPRYLVEFSVHRLVELYAEALLFKFAACEGGHFPPVGTTEDIVCGIGVEVAHGDGS